MKRCPRCETNYTDDVRWCPADGTPTENIAPISPSALAAAATAGDIPEGSPTIRDMPAVHAEDSSPTIPESAGMGAADPTGPQGRPTLLGATTPEPRTPAPLRVQSTFLGATSPVHRAPASPTPTPAIAAQPASPLPNTGTTSEPPRGPHVPSPGAITAGWDIPELPVSGPTTVPGALLPPITSPLPNTFMGTTSEPTRAPAGPHVPAPGAITAGDIPDVSTSGPTTIPGAPIPPLTSPLPNTFMGTTSEPPRLPAGPHVPAPGAITAGWDIPEQPPGSSLTGSIAPSMTAAPVAHQPGAVSLGWDIPEPPPGSTLTGSVAPSTPVAHQPGAVSLGWDIPEPPPGSSLTGSVTPADAHVHTPGPVSLGWDSPEQPPGSTLTGSVTPTALAVAQDPQQTIEHPHSTLPGFAPPAEIVRAIQDQRARTAALRVPQPLSAPEVSPEAYESSTSTPVAQPSTPPVDTPAQQGTVPSFAPPPPQSPQPPQPQLVPRPPVLPSRAPAKRPPSASTLEAPAYPTPTAKRERSASQTDEALQASRGNRTLWIILVLVAVAIASVIALVATR